MLSTAILVGGIVVYVNYKHKGGSTESDHKKIIAIADNCGLYLKDGKGNKKSIRIRRKSKVKDGMEYIYQIPLGMSFSDFQGKIDKFEDGINISQKWRDISLDDIKNLKVDKTIFKQVKSLMQKTVRTNKEVHMDWDGMLKVIVYDRPLTTHYNLTDEFTKSCKGWQIPLGMSRTNLYKHDMEEGHIVVGGLTRMGKTVLLKSMITNLIDIRPEDTILSLIDLKGGLAFSRFRKCSQVKYDAYDAHSAREVLSKLTEEMRIKWEEYREKGYEDIGESGETKRHFIIIDEGAEVSSSNWKGEERDIRVECERYLSEIARLGAGLGYRLIYATQYPTADVIPRQVKQNSPTRICFKLGTAKASHVVLDQSGAEQLPSIKGRAIVLKDKMEIIQCPYIDNDYIKQKITPHIIIKSRSEDDEYKETHSKTGENRENFGIIEKPRLPYNKSNKSNSQSKRL